MKTKFSFFSLAALCAWGAHFSVAAASVQIVPNSPNARQLSPQSARFEAHILAGARIAKVTETWVFNNSAAQNFEGEFVCEAPRGAVMSAFAYWYRGEKVVARVVEKERAANIYNLFNPVTVPPSQRRDPALVQMLERNFLQARIGPIDAQKPLKIELQYLQVLEENAGKLVLPLHLRGAQNVKADFDFEFEGIETQKTFWRAANLPLSAKSIELPSSASLEMPLVSVNTLKSAAKNGFFAAVLEENAWQERDSWRGAREIVWKALDDRRVLVAARFAEMPDELPPAQTDLAARTLWMALRIESLEKDQKNWGAVRALSHASNLPSRFSSWLAIPTSEREAMKDVINPPNSSAQRWETRKLGEALAKWAAMGKTNTPQYREMLTEFRERAARHNYSLEAAFEQYGFVVANSLERYANTSSDVRGSKIPVFRAQLKRLKFSQAESFLESATQVLRVRRALPALHAQIARGRKPNYQTLGWRSAPHNIREIVFGGLAQTLVKIRARNESKLAQSFDREMRRLAAFWGDESGRKLAVERAEWEIYSGRVGEIETALANLIKWRQENTPRFAQLQQELKRISARTETFKEAGPTIQDEVGRLYIEAQIERRKDSPDAAKIAKLDSERARIVNAAGWNQEAALGVARQAWRNKARDSLALLWAQSALRNGHEAARTQQLEKELRAINTSDWEFRNAEARQLSNEGEQLWQRYRHLWSEPGTSPDELQAVQVQLETLQSRARFNATLFSDRIKDGALWKRQSLEQKIRDEWNNTPPDMARLAALEAKLTDFYTENQWQIFDQVYRRFWLTGTDGTGRGTAKEYIALRSQRMGVQEQLKTAAKKLDAMQENNASLAELNAVQNVVIELRQRENQLKVRMGDPLIAVKAPRDTQKIVAILPTGEVKTLLWNEKTQEFEARFDVPTYAPEGDFKVEIRLVLADGTRRRFAMIFGVDLQAPQGVAFAHKIEKQTLLRLESDEQTDRVSAFTPWNARVELRRDESGAFTAPLEIPLEWREKAAQIRFVLTDKAHNRTDILVDLAP